MYHHKMIYTFKLWFQVSTEKLFPFSPWILKQPFGKLYTYIILHSEGQASRLNNNKQKTF